MAESRSSGRDTEISEQEGLDRAVGFLKGVFIEEPLPNSRITAVQGFYSHLIRGLLKLRHIRHGHISCILSVKPAVTNFFRSLHGGAVAAVAETLAFACATTVVAEGTQLFLGELSVSYLSAAPQHAEMIVEGSVVKSGTNLTVIQVEFKLQETGKLAYTARATFYTMPFAKL